MFALDRDLLVLEPALLRDVAWAGQRLIDSTATVAATTLTINTGSLETAGVEQGHVVLFDGLALEVIARLSPTQATVSLVRPRRDGATIPPPPGVDRTARIYTFAPQIELAHRRVLGMIGIDPDGTPILFAPAVTEAAVTNPGALVRLEALGALHLIYAGAPGTGADPNARAALYRQRSEAERARVTVHLDLDNDGAADATRRLGAFVMVRG